MASSAINKFVASATSLSNELTLAAANINLDFTLIKLEAPKEYRAINDSLTETRRNDAEGGALHRTARKLGALFEGTPPPAENLLSAYGKRVTEICERIKQQPKRPGQHGLFSRFVGPDAGSLWAAATSGANAIAIHLLACLIAEMFDGSQSVAIWYQLIEKRKQELTDSIDDSMDQMKAMSRALACKQDFSREELATWDNSARSWGRTANTVMAEQREKTLVYSDNVGIDVNKLTDPYDSVIQAWRDAMMTMDLLLTGVPQRVRNGAIVLAMTSWQLFPDLCVLSDGPGVKDQGDELFPSPGILTIDLESSEEAKGGVAWSLPLSYLRYYGGPVVVDKSFGVASSRITMDKFRFVMLGCVLSRWTAFTETVDDSMHLIMMLLEALRRPERSSKTPRNVLERMHRVTSRTSWIGMLLTTAEDFNDSHELEKRKARKLIDHGRRNGRFLCDLASHALPLFGLCHVPSIFSLLSGPEHRLQYLRAFAVHTGLSNDKFVIRYGIINPEKKDSFAFATIKPVDDNFGAPHLHGYTRRRTPPSLTGRHFRWVPIQRNKFSCQCGDTCLSHRDIQQQKRLQKPTRQSFFSFRQKKEPTDCPCIIMGTCSLACHDWRDGKQRACLHGKVKHEIASIARTDEHCLPVYETYQLDEDHDGKLDFGNGLNFDEGINDLAKKPERKGDDPDKFVSLKFWAGDRKTAEILVVEDESPDGVNPDVTTSPPGHLGQTSSYRGEIFPAKLIRQAFKPKHFNNEKLTEWFAKELGERHNSYVKSLRACAAAVEMYTRLPEATVDPMIVTQVNLSTTPWVPDIDPRNRHWYLRGMLDRANAFACIATFESGRVLDPSYLRNVFAMTSGNSIFVASPMLTDPHDVPMETEIKRVPGNIGKPGLSLLVPPPSPCIRETNPESWQFLNYATFSGQIEDNFWKTSMHLSLTQYQPGLPNPDQDSHFIDESTVLRETLVQVYDSSTWVCDLDILSALTSDFVSRIPCKHCTLNIPRPTHSTALADFQREFYVVCVDNWEELLTEPLDTPFSLVRTAGNWLSRLAAVGVSVRLEKRTIILPETECWDCVYHYMQDSGFSYHDHSRTVLIM